MKKLCILMLLLSMFNTTFSAMRDKLGIKYAYQCMKCDKFLKAMCSTHESSCFKIHLLDDTNVLLEEFKKNEPRALHNYNDEENIFFMKGTIKSLDSGAFDDKYIIVFEDGTDVYINEEEQEKYFELNKGDSVFVYADSPTMSFGELTFKNGHILKNVSYKDFNDMLDKF